MQQVTSNVDTKRSDTYIQRNIRVRGGIQTFENEHI